MINTSQIGELDHKTVMSIQKNTFRHVGDDVKTSIMQNRGGQQVIERLLAAYGFKSRQELCNHLGISQSTMANRYARDTFPADWVVICSIETGTSIEWLALGSHSRSEPDSPIEIPSSCSHNNTEHDENLTTYKNPIETNFDLNQGGKAAIERLVDAYGFTTRQALADHLNVSKSTLANRYMRDTFPSDWIIQCAIETGASLNWLTSGAGPAFEDTLNDVVSIPYQKLICGKIHSERFLKIDKLFLNKNIISPLALYDNGITYIAESKFDDINDGKWLIEIDGDFSLKELTRMPAGKIKVTSQITSFECLLTEVKMIAKCKSSFIKNIERD